MKVVLLFSLALALASALPANDVRPERRGLTDDFKYTLSKAAAQLETMVSVGFNSATNGVMAAWSWVTSFFKGDDGQIPLEHTGIVLDYHLESCSVKWGRKRFLISRECKAKVTEPHSLTSSECIQDTPQLAVECATEQVVEKLAKLAEQVVAGTLD